VGSPGLVGGGERVFECARKGGWRLKMFPQKDHGGGSWQYPSGKEVPTKI